MNDISLKLQQWWQTEKQRRRNSKDPIEDYMVNKKKDIVFRATSWKAEMLQVGEQKQNYDKIITL